jgi:cell wall-associated NlpC family hydrolase
MTDARTSSARRLFGRRALVALTLGAGMALTPTVPALANSGATTVGTTAAAPAAAPTGAAQVAVDTALAQIGDPYVWAGAGPSSFDCSGLTQYAYAAAGISLPHSSSMQSGVGTPVAYSDLQPGDLVFFYSPVSHVAMYIGNGQIVHAPYSGTTVQVTQLSYMPEFAGARRIA